jgi:endonuclease YncB( thermonuclease family)
MGRAAKYPRQRCGRQQRSLPYLVYRLLPIVIILGMIAAANFAERGWAFVSSKVPSITMSSAFSAGQTLVGRATVIDGDTIEITGQRIRFNGIDAPESAQRCQNASGKSYACGPDAANALDEFLAASRPATCRFVDWDQYGRFVGNCARADGQSVQEWLVANGHALDWPRYSNGAFAALEASARQARRGIWQGEFQKPWDWRAAQRDQTTPSEATQSPSLAIVGQSAACNIKGNISRKGERIYHIPGQKYYDRTKISEPKGERWFCSESEARAAGWRKAQR